MLESLAQLEAGWGPGSHPPPVFLTPSRSQAPPGSAGVAYQQKACYTPFHEQRKRWGHCDAMLGHL